MFFHVAGTVTTFTSASKSILAASQSSSAATNPGFVFANRALIATPLDPHVAKSGRGRHLPGSPPSTTDQNDSDCEAQRGPGTYLSGLNEAAKRSDKLPSIVNPAARVVTATSAISSPEIVGVRLD